MKGVIRDEEAKALLPSEPFQEQGITCLKSNIGSSDLRSMSLMNFRKVDLDIPNVVSFLEEPSLKPQARTSVSGPCLC